MKIKALKIPVLRKIPIVWAAFYLSRIFYMFFALLVYGKMTQLGDSASYFKKPFGFYSNFLFDSTDMMRTAGGILGTMFFRTYITHVFFLSLSFYGMYYAIKKINLTKNETYLLLILLCFPSFSSWTTIIGKEAVGVFSTGLVLGYFIDFMKNGRKIPKIIELVGFYLVAIFKPQYLVAFIHAWLAIYIIQMKANGWVKFFFLTCIVLGDSIIFYLLRDILDGLSSRIVPHFRLSAGATRVNTFWVDQYDIFYSAPLGMFLGLTGPTLGEVIKRPVQLFPFLESMAYVSSIFLLWGAMFYADLIKGKVNLQFIFVWLFVCFWILFVHYPFGVLNPGSAIRYRSNFYHLFPILIFFFWSSYKNKYRYRFFS